MPVLKIFLYLLSFPCVPFVPKHIVTIYGADPCNTFLFHTIRLNDKFCVIFGYLVVVSIRDITENIHNTTPQS